mmetsp:Transcript_8251/g.15526  ORF Transcript_8251/g.15526 Transcript_8251/m.15526 type:complete len:81 (+) Transcript_8251:288-530(+)
MCPRSHRLLFPDSKTSYGRCRSMKKVSTVHMMCARLSEDTLAWAITSLSCEMLQRHDRSDVQTTCQVYYQRSRCLFFLEE